MVDVSKLPCRFKMYSPVQKEFVLAKPSVECSEDCERCGWNPEVQKVRLNRLYRKKRLAAVILNRQKGECEQ